VSTPPILVVGLGNPLAGDDGIGYRMAEALSQDLTLPDGVEVECGGTDLLRLEDRMANRAHVIVLDALLDDGPPGRLRMFGPEPADLCALVETQGHAHHLSAAQAILLLRSVTGTLAGTSVVLLGITVRGTVASPELSPDLAARLPRLVRDALDTIRRLMGAQTP
jgi:hydrogenase maturation protease